MGVDVPILIMAAGERVESRQQRDVATRLVLHVLANRLPRDASSYNSCVCDSNGMLGIEEF